MGPSVSDHALLRFLDRAAELGIEELRAHLASSLARAHASARSLSSSDYLIRADGMIFVVRGDTVTTILEDKDPRGLAAALANPGVSNGRSTEANRDRQA